jgi:hypothetical protein
MLKHVLQPFSFPIQVSAEETEAMRGISTGSHGQRCGLEGTQLSPQFKGRFGCMCRTLPVWVIPS